MLRPVRESLPSDGTTRQQRGLAGDSGVTRGSLGHRGECADPSRRPQRLSMKCPASKCPRSRGWELRESAYGKGQYLPCPSYIQRRQEVTPKSMWVRPS